MKDEGSRDAVTCFHPSTFRLHPFQSPAADQVKEFAEAFQDADLKRGKLGLIEGSRIYQFKGRLSRVDQFVCVADEVGDGQWQFAVLPGSQDVSRAAQLKIRFCHLKPA